jgi:hypothetical protein
MNIDCLLILYASCPRFCNYCACAFNVHCLSHEVEFGDKEKLLQEMFRVSGFDELWLGVAWGESTIKYTQKIM